jgi:pyridoxamine 5'-phosphate oxidase-like protein
MKEPTAEPVAELDARFGDPGATPTSWSEARGLLDSAKVYWLSTVRPDGRPHVTPIAAVWVDGALHFTTGKAERKAKNLERNTQVVATTGSNLLEGLDVVVEGEAVPVTGEARLQRLADAYIAKYDDLFVFQVRDNALWIEGSEDPGLAFEVRPTKAFGFGKTPYSQTRWRF